MISRNSKGQTIVNYDFDENSSEAESLSQMLECGSELNSKYNFELSHFLKKSKSLPRPKRNFSPPKKKSRLHEMPPVSSNFMEDFNEFQEEISQKEYSGNMNQNKDNFGSIEGVKVLNLKEFESFLVPEE